MSNMTVEEIKSAMSVYNTKIWKESDLNDYKKVAKTEDYECAKLHSDCAKLAIKALQNELERVENKPLTIEQLKDMVGEPIYVYERGEWIVIDNVDNVYELESELQATDSEVFTFDFTEDNPCMFSFYKYKPQEVRNE